MPATVVVDGTCCCEDVCSPIACPGFRGPASFPGYYWFDTPVVSVTTSLGVDYCPISINDPTNFPVAGYNVTLLTNPQFIPSYFYGPSDPINMCFWTTFHPIGMVAARWLLYGPTGTPPAMTLVYYHCNQDAAVAVYTCPLSGYDPSGANVFTLAAGSGVSFTTDDGNVYTVTGSFPPTIVVHPLTAADGFAAIVSRDQCGCKPPDTCFCANLPNILHVTFPGGNTFGDGSAPTPASQQLLYDCDAKTWNTPSPPVVPSGALHYWTASITCAGVSTVTVYNLDGTVYCTATGPLTDIDCTAQTFALPLMSCGGHTLDPGGGSVPPTPTAWCVGPFNITATQPGVSSQTSAVGPTPLTPVGTSTVWAATNTVHFDPPITDAPTDFDVHITLDTSTGQLSVTCGVGVTLGCSSEVRDGLPDRTRTLPSGEIQDFYDAQTTSVCLACSSVAVDSIGCPSGG